MYLARAWRETRTAGDGPIAEEINLLFKPARGLDIGCDSPALQQALGATDNAYDLVVCRDALERLAVLHMCEAIRHICRISSRYVYISTRYHPSPAGLLDVAMQPTLDSSPATLVNRDFLRVLFVLEGFRRREDLETRINEMRAGRALVYEQTERDRGGSVRA